MKTLNLQVFSNCIADRGGHHHRRLALVQNAAQGFVDIQTSHRA